MTVDQCNACGSSLTVRFGQVPDPQTKENFQILECQSCGLGHTSPSPEDLAPYYGKAYHGGRHGMTAQYCAWRRCRFVHEAAGFPNGRKLLDIGCGDGTFLLAAKAKGWSVYGTEMNTQLGRDAGLDVRESVDAMENEGPFAVVTIWHVLEHLKDPKGTLEKVAKLLQPGGSLLIAVPDADGIQARLFGNKWFHLDVPRHLFHFGDKSLSRLLEASGFDVLKRRHQEFEFDVLGWSQSALNKVMPEPNAFFYRLTGRAPELTRGELAANYTLGTALSALAIPATAASTLVGKGGTLVLTARRKWTS